MRKAILVLVFLLLVPAFALAQSAKDSWGNLKQLRAGQKIEVVDTSMKSLRGPLVSVSEEAITLRVGKSQECIERAKVVRVSVRDNSHRARNMLLGSGILGGIALAAAYVPLVASSNEGNSCGVCVVTIVAGFGGGAAFGAIPGSRTVYRAKK